MKGKKANLTSQSCHWWITIRKNIEISKNLIRQWCDTMSAGDMYAFIEHKGDISTDTGEVEGCHYHIVMNTAKRVQKAKLLNSICDYFGFDNPFGIEVDIYISFEGCLQYLTHQNVKEKTQHDRQDIIYNFDSDLFNSILDTPLKSELNAEALISIILKSRNKVDVLKEIGLGHFNLYSRVIDMLWKELK